MEFFVGLLMVQLSSVHALTLAPLQESQESRGRGYYKQVMKNIDDVSYVATMKIGNQEIDAVLDTGSFDVEVISARCGTSCQGASSTLYYNRNSSHTYEEGDLIQLTSYESGDVLSQSGTETVAFGSLEIKNQAFWEVVYAQLDILAYGDFQAIVGVGPPGTDPAEIAEEAKAAEHMKSQFKKLGFLVPKKFSKELYEDEVPKMKTVLEMLDTKLFSVCLGQQYGSKGYFIWNDYNPTGNPAFRDVEVAGKITWGITLTDAIMKDDGANQDLSIACSGGHSCAAIVDSGTSLLMVPTSVYNDLFDYLKSLQASCDRMDQLPSLVIKLAGQEFKLPPARYMGFVDESSLERTGSGFFPFLDNQSMELSQTRNKKSCVLSIGKIDVDTQLGPMWILGMPFFREYYTTFELGHDQRDKSGRRVHLAKADSNCEPQKGGDLAIDQNRRKYIPMPVKSKHLRVPRWAVRAHTKGRINV